MLLEIDNLCLSFGGLKATNDVTMHMEEKKINGIIGPNGAGKTRFLTRSAASISRTAEALYLTERELTD